MMDDETKAGIEQIEIELGMFKAELDHEQSQPVPFMSNDAYEQGQKIGQIEVYIIFLELWIDHYNQVLVPLDNKFQEYERRLNSVSPVSVFTIINMVLFSINFSLILRLVLG